MPQAVDISIRPSNSLSPKGLDEIWGLTARYVDTSREHYEAKLLALPEVGLWRVRGGELVGLVSLRVRTVRWEGRTRIIIFTSNVVADERFRGRNLVLKTGMRVFARERLRRPFAPAYWFFDTFSYKSYLILARNLGEYWPRRDQPTPPGIVAFIDDLATEQYDSHWNRHTGVVRRSGHKQLRPDTAPIDAKLLSDPDVCYFEAANPGHRQGDMLVCLAPLTLRNLWGAVSRAARR